MMKVFQATTRGWLALAVALAAAASCGDDDGGVESDDALERVMEEQEYDGEEVDVEELEGERAQLGSTRDVVAALTTGAHPEITVYNPPPDLALPAPGPATATGPQQMIEQGIDTPYVAGQPIGGVVRRPRPTGPPEPGARLPGRDTLRRDTAGARADTISFRP